MNQGEVLFIAQAMYSQPQNDSKPRLSWPQFPAPRLRLQIARMREEQQSSQLQGCTFRPETNRARPERVSMLPPLHQRVAAVQREKRCLPRYPPMLFHLPILN